MSSCAWTGAFHAFFRRLKAGEAPGYPRFQGRRTLQQFHLSPYGGGVTLDGGILSRSKIGRIPVRVHRQLEGIPKSAAISREADGWYACFSCVEVPAEPLPLTGKETGIDVGLQAFLITADGEIVETPRYYRQAEERRNAACRARGRAASGVTSITRRRSRCCAPMTPFIWKICRCAT